MTGQGEPLISIPKCALYNVSPRDDDVVVAGVGDLSVGYPAAAAGSGTNPGLEARVGEVSWPLSPQVAALRYDDHTYSFTISQARLDKAKSVAAQVAEVSGKAVGGVLSVTAAAAGALAQKISGTGDMRKVGVAGVEAVEAVYEGLADAARVLLAHGHSATTRVVDHKYGPGAAQATGAGFCVAQSAAETGLHVMKLRPTALVKKVIKGAAKQVVLGSAASASAAASGPGATANGPNGWFRLVTG
eukprot:XP_001701252.1 predicted protein [Chlamydomonas reinhardtii]